MADDVKLIYFKITEQLADPSHPLQKIVVNFHELFVKDIGYFLDMANANDSET